MEEERIDINDLYAAIEKNGGLNGMEEFDSVCAELKRCYERLDVYREELEHWLQTAEQCGWTESILDLRRILNASE
tara:strand:+ start:868 stop:1095 length:228 start_codon:yes stop_codon:yes gene_type:complete